MSLCAMSAEELRVKEKRGRASLADSSSLSILSAGLSLFLGLFRQPEHVSNIQQDDTGRKPNPKLV